MYVDDEADIRTIVELTLKEIGGYEVLLCESGENALDSVTDFAPDLILLDVMMPKMDGMMTLEKLQTLSLSAPVVFMTAKAQPQEIEKFKQLGAVAVITKPFDPIQLPIEVAKIWEQYGQT